MRAVFIALLFVVCLISPGTEVHAAGKDQVTAFANDLGNKAIAVLTDKTLSKEAKHAKLEALFMQSVDIDWIGKFVLGRYWRGATDTQKHQYLINYRTFLIKHYTSNLVDFTDANFQVTKVVPDDSGGDRVTVLLKRPQAEDTVVDYTVRQKEGSGLKVYDIAVEGVSMITTQRSEFNSVVSQKGLDYLIAQLDARSNSEAVGSGQGADSQ